MEEFYSDRGLIIPDVKWIQYITPFTMLVFGGSQTGKTRFVFEMIRNRVKIFTECPQKIYYIYSEKQKMFDDYNDCVHFTQDLGILDELPENENILVIIDDMQDEIKDNKKVQHLFTKGSHHRQINLILILQNLFAQGSIYVNLRYNSNYYVLTEHCSNYSSLEHFIRRFIGGKDISYFNRSYRDMIRQEWGALLIDAHPQSILKKHPYNVLLRSNTNSIEGQILYFPEKGKNI